MVRYNKVLLLAAATVVAGCGREPIRVFEIPKEKLTVHSNTPRPARPHVHLPPGWEEVAPTQMRLASYLVRGPDDTKADVSVSIAGGRDLDNVNRWRSQVGLQPLTEEQLSTNAQPVVLAGHGAQLYEMAGASVENDEPTRILAAVHGHGDTTWFFKMTGDDKLVASQKAAFIRFLAQFPLPGHGPAGGAADPHAGLGAADPHAGLNMAADAGAEAVPSGDWNVPPSWKQQAPGAMQDAKFVAQEGKVVVSVSRAGGAMLANVNRWRGQLGLEPINESALDKVMTSLDLAGGKANLVDLSGATQRMIVAVVPAGQMSVFYKMMGESTAVAAEKEAFVEFVKAAK